MERKEIEILKKMNEDFENGTYEISDAGKEMENYDIAYLTSVDAIELEQKEIQYMDEALDLRVTG